VAAGGRTRLLSAQALGGPRPTLRLWGQGYGVRGVAGLKSQGAPGHCCKDLRFAQAAPGQPLLEDRECRFTHGPLEPQQPTDRQGGGARQPPLYRGACTWLTERVCQQLTAGCHLQALMGTTPQGTGFQCAFCLLLYNLLQVVRASVAAAQVRPPETISTELLFDDAQRQLVALTDLVPPPVVEPLFEPLSSPDRVEQHLTRLLATVWTSRWLKAPAKKPKAPATRKAVKGNQTSVYRLLAEYQQQK
jgi:hypothetical protein